MMAPREPYACNKIDKSKTTECVQSQDTIVHTLTPTLKWEALPRSQDRDMWVDRVLKRISDVTYDLKVVSGSFPWSVVYERTGLKSTSEIGAVGLQKEDTAAHTIEVPLEADSLYLWTVRARYKYSGMEQTLTYNSTAIDGEDLQRQGLTQVLKMGLMPYLSQTSLAPAINIQYRIPANGLTPAQRVIPGIIGFFGCTWAEVWQLKNSGMVLGLKAVPRQTG